MGDGIMALFGAPVAHEDHAVRACYAALRMQELVKGYAEQAFRAHGVTVRIRVGLNSGEVVVRSIRSDLRMDYSAVGQTTHLAAPYGAARSPGRYLDHRRHSPPGRELRAGPAPRPRAVPAGDTDAGAAPLTERRRTKKAARSHFNPHFRFEGGSPGSTRVT